ncbi:acyl-CoA thioester hydrolase/BAAT C-terminal domain-containing protein [Bacillus sp. CLL-7-23]|uniref:Acyl-CoA thioester hydrolase/BAAT C-terminal domain-containing protein n=1 Tax=Bacillus changyiensis TaxID=3004103 RepID=A0ABT4X7B0_9BACI|nr:acyl-CoA thioester hydrolase/BAAT C-terminal domain-containing protein [Bacillus changyiensis]MDA7028153.1 acyl-CoA thioester hydrolase/BAAT C-terminal domain-containing protein [Bacillus changyiensis]
MIRLHIPLVSKWDEEINLKVQGLQPHDLIDIMVSVKDDANITWKSYAIFQANEFGVVDPRVMAPLNGTYDGQEQMGLFWSMKAIGSSHSFQKKTVHPSRYRIEIKQNENTIVSQDVKRVLLSGTTCRQEVGGDGWTGTFFRPLSVERPPIIIVVGGSDGGLDETIAALLSNHGYATLALPYFQYKQLPKQLVEIPLEYFQDVITWIFHQEGINHKKMGIFGRSKGGELALLIASHFPEVRFVVSHVGGGIIFQGVGLKNFRKTSSWSLNGTPLAFAPLELLRPSQLWKYLKQKITRQPQVFVQLYQQAIQHLKDDHPSIIKVEHIKGPILLTSSTDDAVWPSRLMSEKVVKRLKLSGYQHFVQHVCFENAGHHIRPPYFPTTARQSQNVIYGGETVSDARASQKFWEELLLFLEKVTSSSSSKEYHESSADE